ncbi:MAG: PP2C family protein-serine/threonine phosphatase, partial [Planctomycetota bacterium]
SIVKTVIDYIDLNDKTPSEVLKDFNSRFRSVLGPMAPQIYATGIVMMVDGENRLLSLACAGHASALHINKRRMSAEPIMELDQSGPALGFISDPDYPSVERQLSVGDIVLGFTDGIYEVLNEQEEMFGLARLQRLVADNARLVPRDLIQRIITETEEFMGTAIRPDDVCLVAVEVY